MSERAVTIGAFNTVTDWGLILNQNKLSAPEVQTEKVTVPGRDGDFDFTEVLTGEPKYKNRTWEAVFIMTEGTAAERAELLSAIRNYLHGHSRPFILPDDKFKYLIGRFTVTDEQHNKAYSTFSVSADCEPHRYFIEPYKRTVSLSSTVKTLNITNHGSKTVKAEITATNATIVLDGVTYEYKNNKKPVVKIPAGDHIMGVSGSGTLAIEYTEGVL